MAIYVALLRGINVGGKNIIRMSELRVCFEGMGFSGIYTYIQSGNVIFQSQVTTKTLSEQIEKTLSKKFKYKSKVVIISRAQLKNVIEQAPKHFGVDKENYHYDVIFLKEPIKPKDVLKDIKAHTEVDRVYGGKRVIYFSRLIEKASQSQLSKIAKHPLYQQMTIRNWNTTEKLLKLSLE